jgi:hypothetical protein
MTAMCIERMESSGKGAAAGLPVICWVHVQGLGRGQAAGYGAHCTNQAAEVNKWRLKEQRKAEAPPPLPPPPCSSSLFRNSTSRVSFQAKYHPFAYRPPGVRCAGTLTVPSTCMRLSHVPEVTSPPHSNHCTGDIFTRGTPDTARFHGIKARHGPAYSIGTISYERTWSTQNTTLLTIHYPLLRRKRRAQTSGGQPTDPRDIAVARSRRFRSPQRCRFAPRFSAIFIFIGKFDVYRRNPTANLGASHTFFSW